MQMWKMAEKKKKSRGGFINTVTVEDELRVERGVIQRIIDQQLHISQAFSFTRLPQLQGEISPKEDSFGCSSGLAALQVYDTPHIRVLVGERVRKRLDAKSIEKSKMENRTVLADDFAIHHPLSSSTKLYPILLGGSFNERKAK